MEKVARTEFAADPDDLDLPTFIYVLLGKVKAASIIWSRSKHSESKKIQDFLGLNFENVENRLKAEKNAFALIGKQRFGKCISHKFVIYLLLSLELALAFFLLAGKVDDARQLAKKLTVEYRIIINRFCIANSFVKVLLIF